MEVCLEKRVGNLAEITTTSFFPAKPLDVGCVLQELLIV